MTRQAPQGPGAPLGVAVFGVSTPFAYWGFSAVYEIVRRLAGETVRLHLTEFEALHQGVSSRGGASVVITTDFPETELCSFLCDAPLPKIAFGDTVDDMVDWAADSRRLTLPNAVRFTSHMLSALGPGFAAPGTLILGPWMAPPEIVAAVAEHLRPGSGAGLYEDLVAQGVLAPELPDWRSQPRPAPVEDDVPYDPASVPEMKAALNGYLSYFEGRAPQEIGWTRPMFTFPGAEALAIDLTGPARAVMYGPYMHLPRGRWAARVEFEIDGAISGVEAATDVYMSEVLVEKAFAMPEKGIFAYTLAFETADTSRSLEIRLFIKRSALEGTLLIRSVVVRAV